MLTKDQLQHLKMNWNKRKDILNRFKDNDHFQLNSAFPYDSWGELSAYDNHPGDQATELYEREKTSLSTCMSESISGTLSIH